jgi:Outer membrane protein beta-barrel domain
MACDSFNLNIAFLVNPFWGGSGPGLAGPEKSQKHGTCGFKTGAVVLGLWLTGRKHREHLLEAKMSGTRLWIAVLCVVAFAASLAAQDEKNEVGVTFGRVFISDQGIQGATYFDPVIHSGKGLSFEGDYARKFLVTPLFSVAGEVPVLYNYDEKLNGGGYGDSVVPTNYKELFVTPSARVNLFPTTAVSPWVSFGVGFGHISESNTLVYGGTNPGKTTTSATIQGGFGLDVKVWQGLSIRGEVRDFWSGEPDFPLAPTGKSRQHNYFVGGGVFYRF